MREIDWPSSSRIRTPQRERVVTVQRGRCHLPICTICTWYAENNACERTSGLFFISAVLPPPGSTTAISRVRRFCCCRRRRRCFCCFIFTIHPLKPFHPVVLPSNMRTTTTAATTTTTWTRILRKINNAVRFIVVGSRAYLRRTR